MSYSLKYAIFRDMIVKDYLTQRNAFLLQMNFTTTYSFLCLAGAESGPTLCSQSSCCQV